MKTKKQKKNYHFATVVNSETNFIFLINVKFRSNINCISNVLQSINESNEQVLAYPELEQAHSEDSEM